MNKTREMYQHLSREFEATGGWAIDRKAARDIRIANYINTLLEPSPFMLERMPEAVTTLRCLLTTIQSRALATSSSNNNRLYGTAKSKNRKLRLQSRSSVVKRRVVLTPLNPHVEEHTVLQLDSPSPPASPLPISSSTLLPSPARIRQVWFIPWCTHTKNDVCMSLVEDEENILGYVRDESRAKGDLTKDSQGTYQPDFIIGI